MMVTPLASQRGQAAG